MSMFGWNPLAAAGILAALRILDDGLLNHVREMGDLFLRGLERLELSAPVKTKGKGLMLGIEVGLNRDGFLKRLQEERILAIPAADNVVRFLPPYIIQKEQVQWALEKIEKVFVPMA